jgi:hypothetical protein
MRVRFCAAMIALVMLTGAAAPPDMAAIFGAREGLVDLSLSPGGTKIAFVSPAAG